MLVGRWRQHVENPNGLTPSLHEICAVLNPEAIEEPEQSEVVSRVQAEVIDTLPDGTRYGLGMVCREGPILVRMVHEGDWLPTREGNTWCEALHVMATARTWADALVRLQEATEDETQETA